MTPPQTTKALNAQHLSVNLSGRAILREIEFSAGFGEVTAIAGPNGAGKTTLLKALAGLLPYSGSLTYQGQELAGLSIAARAQQVAYVPQSSLLNAHLSAEQVVAMGRFASRPQALSLAEVDAEHIRCALASLELTELAERSYLTLSGGQQRRVLLARALATGARILLLDEPSISLDIRHTLALFAELSQLAADHFAVICVLHDLDDLRRYAHKTLLLQGGERSTFGSTETVLRSPKLEEAFDVRIVPNDRLGYRIR